MKKIIVVFCVLASSALLLEGCSKSSGVLETMTPLDLKLANGKTLMVSVSSTEPDAAEEIAQMERMTVEKLKDKKQFLAVVPGSSAGRQKTELNLVLTISSLKKVTNFQRKMYGPAAGRAFVIVEGKMVDLKTRKTIGEFRIQGESSAGSAMAGTTPQAIERAVEQIVLFVQGSK